MAQLQMFYSERLDQDLVGWIQVNFYISRAGGNISSLYFGFRCSRKIQLGAHDAVLRPSALFFQFKYLYRESAVSNPNETCLTT